MADIDITRFRRYPQLANLVREPNESNKDWQKRLDRERKRLKRGDAIELGAPKQATGGHRHGESTGLIREPGESDADWVKRRMRAVMRRRRDNPELREKEDQRRRELYAQNGDSEQRKAWKEANKEKIDAWHKEYAKDYYQKNKSKRQAALKAWQDANPERMKEVRKKYREENPHIFTASVARIRAQMINARPIWVDNKEIEVFYREAKRLTKKTGIEHQVDHIVPLNGKNVCGLHVPWNLRVITKEENMKKRNRLDLSLLIDAA